MTTLQRNFVMSLVVIVVICFHPFLEIAYNNDSKLYSSFARGIGTMMLTPPLRERLGCGD